jgi:hypothetical protein
MRSKPVFVKGKIKNVPFRSDVHGLVHGCSSIALIEEE